MFLFEYSLSQYDSMYDVEGHILERGDQISRLDACIFTVQNHWKQLTNGSNPRPLLYISEDLSISCRQYIHLNKVIEQECVKKTTNFLLSSGINSTPPVPRRLFIPALQ